MYPCDFCGKSDEDVVFLCPFSGRAANVHHRCLLDAYTTDAPAHVKKLVTYCWPGITSRDTWRIMDFSRAWGERVNELVGV
jgi:hypothetical protein